jgi:1,4-dihydroxy-2-naphthoate octaprenyltransferase
MTADDDVRVPAAEPPGIVGPGEGLARPGRLALALQATRPLYLLTSLLPGLIGLAVAIGAQHVKWWAAPVAMVALLCVHAGANVINDVEDFARGVDVDVDKVDSSRVFTGGLMTVREGRRLARMLFGASFALGVLLVVVQGPALLVIGVLGLLVGYGYSAGPRPLKYVGLGDVAIVPVMGPLITQGAYTAVTGDGFAASAFWIGFAPGLLIAAVLGANNLSDIAGDRAAGVRTVAVRLGFSRARALFVATVALAYAVPVTVAAAGLLQWPVLLPLLTLPLAIRRVAQACAARSDGADSLRSLVPLTAQLHMAFCVLLVVGIVLGQT